MRGEIKKHLDAEANEWIKQFIKSKEAADDEDDGSESDEEETKGKGTKFLCSAAILPILKSKFPKEDNEKLTRSGKPDLFVTDRETGEKRYVFDSFDGFTTYLGKFQQTRKNLYLATGEATAVPTRIISNFIIFLNNEKTFNDKIRQLTMKSSIPKADTSLLESKNYHLSFLQDGISAYNDTIGAVNKQVKEWRDQAKKDEKSNYPLLKRMEKQILAEVERRIELVKEDSDVLPRFQEFVQETSGRMDEAGNLFSRLFAGEFAEEYEKIFINHKAANTIAYHFFADPIAFLKELPPSGKKMNEENPQVAPFVSIRDIFHGMEKMAEKSGGEKTEKVCIFKAGFYKEKGNEQGIISETQGYGQQLFAVWENELRELYEGAKYDNGAERIFGLNEALKDAENFIETARVFGEKGHKRDKDIAIIKHYADAALAIHQRLSHFALEAKKEDDKPTEYSDAFYNGDQPDEIGIRGLSALFRWGEKEIEIMRDGKKTKELLNDDRGMPLLVRYYNAFRNHLTKKQGEGKKIKINFEKGNLLDGWAESPEGNAQYQGYLLIREGKYYLGITDYPHFLDHTRYPEVIGSERDPHVYRKMEFRQLNWGKNIAGGRVYSSFTGGVSFQTHKKELSPKKHIQLLKDLIKEKYLNQYPELSEFISHTYSDTKEMQQEFEKIRVGGITFKNIKADRINNQTFTEDKDKKQKKHTLYLFEITNKDFATKKSGKWNTHSIYFSTMLSTENTGGVINIQGGAEIFHRKALHEKKDAKEIITKKNELNITKEKPERALHDRRFLNQKYLFHLPIVLNGDKNVAKKFNNQINNFLAKAKKQVNVIGIDRGEKHLAYFMVIDQSENVLDGGSLNEINGIPYHQLLHDRMKMREKNRQSWEPVQQIKDLKRGYIGAVVRKICDLAVQHNAIIVFEDLSFRFKQVRGGIEKSTYQQIEKALIDKLGYLTFKNRTNDELGGILRGYQLAAPFKSFENIGKQKQTGIIFYTQAAYTSAIDPLTGFRKTVYINGSTPEKKIKDVFLEKFDAIFWDKKEESYCFVYNTKNFEFDEKNKKKSGPKIVKEWRVYGKAPRIIRQRKERGHWDALLVNPDELLQDLFRKYDFDIHGDIKAQMKKIQEESLHAKKSFEGRDRGFWERLAFIFNLICQVRNSTSKEYRANKEGGVDEIGSDVDFIASPVPPFFTTGAQWRKYKVLDDLADFTGRFSTDQARALITRDSNGNILFNGDANGAYNIARKGAILLRKISENPENPERYVSNDEFDRFVQK